MEHLGELQTMFPTLDAAVVAMVLSRNKDNVETAVEMLLDMSSQVENQGKSSAAPPPTTSLHSNSSSKIPFQGWSTTQAFPPLPGYNHSHLNHAHIPHGVPQSHRPHQSFLKPRVGPDSVGYHSWSQAQPPGGYYPPPPMSKPGPNRSITSPIERGTVNGGIGSVMVGERLMPERSGSAPHFVVGNTSQWRPPNPGIRNGGNVGHVTGLNPTEHAQSRLTHLFDMPSIPRLQNRHLEQRGRFDAHGQRQGSKGHERSKITGQSTPSVEKKLIIIRGLPGSGKTTLARTLRGTLGVICSTDDFFMVDGKYVFDPNLLAENHEKNRAKARKSMASGSSPVIIDNTNSNAWEMKPYVAMAIEFGYDVEILEPDTPWRFKVAELTKRNKHGVLRPAIERMLERYEHRMSVERILTSERPEETKPPSRTSSSGSNKEKPAKRQNSKEAAKVKAPPTEKQSKEGQKSSTSNHGNKESRKQLVSPKPPKKREKSEQLTKAAGSGDRGGQERRRSSTDSSHSKVKKGNSKMASKSTVSPTPRVEHAPQTEATVNHDLLPAATGKQVPPPVSVPSVAEIEADLLAQEWDSEEESGLLSDEDFSQSNEPCAPLPPIGTKKQKQKEESSEQNALNEAELKVEDPRGNASPETPPSEVAMVTEGMALIEQSWETARRDGTSSSDLTAMFPQLQAPSGPSVSTSLLPPPASIESTVGKTTQASPVSVSDIEVRADEKGGKKDERKLSTLSAALDSCQGWQEKYLTEAARDEEKDLSNRSGVDMALLESLVPRYMPQIMVSFSDGPASNMGVVKKSRLISGLSLKEVSSSEMVSQSDQFVGVLRQGLGYTSGGDPSPLPNETLLNDLESKVAAIGSENPLNSEAESKTVSSLLPLMKSEDTGVLSQALNKVLAQSECSTTFPAVVETGKDEGTSSDSCETESEATDSEDHSRGDADDGGSQDREDEVQLQKFSLSPSNSLDAFLSAEGFEPSQDAAGSAPHSDSTTDSLELELSNAAQQFDIFPSAFPAVSTEDAPPNPKSEPTSNMLLLPPAPTADKSYVSLGDSLYCSEDEEGIIFSAENSMEVESAGAANVTALDKTGQETEVTDNTNVDTELLEEEFNVSSPPSTDSVGGALGSPLSKPPSGDVMDSNKNEQDFVGGSKEEMDLIFLIECFPDLEPNYLKQLMITCDGNLDNALSIALVSMTTPVPLEKLREEPEKSSRREVESPEKMLLSPVSSHDELKEDCRNDEFIAKMLQEQFNKQEAVGSNESSPSSRSKGSEGGEDEEHLVLNLSEILAGQLEALFGSVDQHLPYSGDIQAEDLKVLLSKKVARSIHQKWIQTLETKYQGKVSSKKQRVVSTPQLQLQQDSGRRGPGQQHHSFPVSRSLNEIMDEQLAQELGQEEVVKSVKSVLNVSQHLQLNDLYTRFPEVKRSTVCNILMEQRYNFKEATRQLEKQFPPTAVPTNVQPKVGVVKHTAHPEWREELSYDELRAEAALQATLRAECFQKAARAHSQKKMELAQHYARMGHSHTEKMKEANRRAAKCTVQRHNPDAPARRLDLHGLHVDEALEVLKEKLDTTKKGGPLHVVTGRGSHSEGKVPRIKPAVIKFLAHSDYKFEEVNAGMLKVQLK